MTHREPYEGYKVRSGRSGGRLAPPSPEEGIETHRNGSGSQKKAYDGPSEARPGLDAEYSGPSNTCDGDL